MLEQRGQHQLPVGLSVERPRPFAVSVACAFAFGFALGSGLCASLVFFRLSALF